MLKYLIMHIKEVFLETAKEQEFVQGVKGRGARRRAAKITRREFLGLGIKTVIAGGGILTGGSIAAKIGVDAYRQNLAVEQQLRKYALLEGQLDPLIAGIDIGSDRFFTRLQNILGASSLSPGIKEAVGIPISLEQINRHNPLRNLYALKGRELAKSRNLYADGSVYVEDIRHFFYAILDPSITAQAAYAPVEKSLYLSSKFNPDSLLDSAIKIHEMVHVAQDIRDRTTLPTDVYLGFLRNNKQPKTAVRLYEATAYAIEVVTLDLMLGGRLKRDLTSNTFSVDEYTKLLGARSDQKGTIVTISNLGREFFGSGSTLERLSETYLRYVTRIYQEQGFSVFDRTPNGFRKIT